MIPLCICSGLCNATTCKNFNKMTKVKKNYLHISPISCHCIIVWVRHISPVICFAINAWTLMSELCNEWKTYICVCKSAFPHLKAKDFKYMYLKERKKSWVRWGRLFHFCSLVILVWHPLVLSWPYFPRSDHLFY